MLARVTCGVNPVLDSTLCRYREGVSSQIMIRAFTILLISLSMLNVASGDLLRPCQCGPDNPYSCGHCPSSHGVPKASPAPC